MSFNSYFELEKNEKNFLVDEITSLLKSFCKTKQELESFYQHIGKNVKNVKFEDDDDDEISKNENEEKEKNKKRKKENVVEEKVLEYDSLSPNVIIYRVLPYFLLENVIKKYDCFGYFKRDRLRNIWYLFNSLRINKYKRCCGFYYNVERLKYFNCLGFFKKNDSNSTGLNFRNLEKIKIDNYYGNTPSILDDILKNNSFYKLKSIECRNSREYRDKKMEFNLKGIEKFTISRVIISKMYNANSLKYLKLDEVNIQGFKNLGDLSNVEELIIYYPRMNMNMDSFFNFHKFEKLKVFNYSHCTNEGGVFDNVIVNWKKLIKITFYDVEMFSDKFFQRNRFEKLEELDLRWLPLITGKNWNICSLDKLKKLEIYRCNNFELKNIKLDEIQIIDCRRNGKLDSNIFNEKFRELCNQHVFQLFRNHKTLIKSYLIGKILSSKKEKSSVEVNGCSFIDKEDGMLEVSGLKNLKDENEVIKSHYQFLISFKLK